MPLVAPAPPAYPWLGLPACQVDSVTPANLLREGGHLPPTEWPSCSVTPVNLLRNTHRWRRLQSELLQTRKKGDDSSILSDDSIELSKQFSYSIRRFYGGWNVTSELIDYEKELHDLAYRWHLKAKWSGVVLILSHINDVVGIMSEGDETTIEVSVEVIEPMLDKTPLPPLIFKVTAYELMYSNQGEIVREFANKLSDYEKELKSKVDPIVRTG